MLFGSRATSFVVAVISPAAAGLAWIAAVAFSLPLTTGFTGHARALAFELISTMYHSYFPYGRGRYSKCCDIKSGRCGTEKSVADIAEAADSIIRYNPYWFHYLPFSIAFSQKWQ